VYDPTGLACDSAGNLYVANAGNNTIEKFTLAGVGSVFAGTGPSYPQGLAFDSAGNLYVAGGYLTNSYVYTIQKFTPDGVGSVFASTGLNNPTGLAFDSAGNLYAANDTEINCKIVKFTPAGVSSVFANSGVDETMGLAFDSAGNLYAANWNANPTIEKFTPGGVGSVFASYPSADSPFGLAFDSAGNLYVANSNTNTIEKFTPDGVRSVFASTGLNQPGYVAIQVCSYALGPTEAFFTAAGGSSNIVITANGPSCTWTAVSNSGLIMINSGSIVSGNGTVSYNVAANPDAIVQTGSMTIAGQSFIVTEAAAPCTFSLDSTSANFGSAGGASTVTAMANGTNCAWTAVSNDSFIIITAGASGSGNGVVNYTVAANTSTAPLTGTVTIAGLTYTVTQAAVPCSVSAASTSASFSAAGGFNNVVVTANGANCAWTAVSSNSFVTITSGSSGTGNGTVSYFVAANMGTARTGTMTIAGQMFTVDQTGATPVSFSFTEVEQTCKTKINKKTETTNTTCTVAFDLVVSNTGATRTPKSSVLLWLEQGSNFNPNAGPTPLAKNVKALKGDKSETVKVKVKVIGDQTGTVIFATDTGTNVLAFVEVPSPD
jgi:hypothetical protein